MQMSSLVQRVVLLFALASFALPAPAQVPQAITYTGRLVDDQGIPLPGPVNLELRLFDAATGGIQMYAEQHLGVALDATGGFSVQLGLGSNPSGPFDASLFAEAERWLEVVVGAEVLAPRQVVGSVPWALIAQQANEIVRAPGAPRFEDCGDGTVADHETGLQWEKKTGTPTGPIECVSLGCPDPHDVNNTYIWSFGAPPDGDAFTDFLAKLNDPTFGTAATPNDVTGCFAGRCDWRLPNSVELQGIHDCGPGVPCIDPIFGPTTTFDPYWTSSALDPGNVWTVHFGFVFVFDHSKSDLLYTRAVRAGSCDP